MLLPMWRVSVPWLQTAAGLHHRLLGEARRRRVARPTWARVRPLTNSRHGQRCAVPAGDRRDCWHCHRQHCRLCVVDHGHRVPAAIPTSQVLGATGCQRARLADSDGMRDSGGTVAERADHPLVGAVVNRSAAAERLPAVARPLGRDAGAAIRHSTAIRWHPAWGLPTVARLSGRICADGKRGPAAAAVTGIVARRVRGGARFGRRACAG